MTTFNFNPTNLGFNKLAILVKHPTILILTRTAIPPTSMKDSYISWLTDNILHIRNLAKEKNDPLFFPFHLDPDLSNTYIPYINFSRFCFYSIVMAHFEMDLSYSNKDHAMDLIKNHYVPFYFTHKTVKCVVAHTKYNTPQFILSKEYTYDYFKSMISLLYDALYNHPNITLIQYSLPNACQEIVVYTT